MLTRLLTPSSVLALVLLTTTCAPSGSDRAPSEVAAPARSGAVGESARAGFDAGAQTLGLDQRHHHGGTGGYHFPEVMGGGVAWLDFDGDGDLDVFLPQGTALAPAGDGVGWPAPSEPPGDRLWRYDAGATPGGGRFVDASRAAGLDRIVPGYGMGVAVGDVDGDGDPDLYVARWGRDRLLVNQGDGTFRDLTEAAGLGDDGWSSAASFADLDGDGHLDLYVVRYVRFALGDGPVCRTEGGRVDYCGPLRYPAQNDLLYRGRGDGTFEDATPGSGIAGLAGRGLSAVVADLDGDGLDDVLVANDGTDNHLWRNTGGLRFVDQALEAGVAVNLVGEPEASMGIARGDVDDDGALDVFLTHLYAETSTLYLNDGRGLFRDASMLSGLGVPSFDVTSFGTAFLDADHDGHLDLAVASGHVRIPPAREADADPFPLDQHDQLFAGRADGTWVDVTLADPAFRDAGTSRGLAVGDFEPDGDLDLLIVDSGASLRLLRNLHDRGDDWLKVGFASGDATAGRRIGTRVRLIEPSGRSQYRWTARDGSYASSSPPVAHFGLGDPGGGDDLVLTVDARSVRLRIVGLPGGVQLRFPAPRP